MVLGRTKDKLVSKPQRHRSPITASTTRLLLVITLTCCRFDPSVGFVVTPRRLPVVTSSSLAAVTTDSLAAEQDRRNHGKNKQNKSSFPITSIQEQDASFRYAHPRLDDVEHEQCLQDVLELRRIRSVLKKHYTGTKNAKDNNNFVWKQSQLCGYGDDIDAFESAISKGERSRELLITNHLGLVHFVVNDVWKRRKLHSMKKEDLVQEGVIGLARALEKYEPNKFHTKLSTYSVYWIRAVVLRAIAEKDSALYVPAHIQQTASRLHNGHLLWNEASQAKQLAESLGVTDRHLHEAILVKNRKFLSFEALTSQRNLMDSSEQQAQNGMDLPYMKQALSMFLGPREVEALSWRYGLNTGTETSNYDKRSSPSLSLAGGGRWGEAMSFSEVGQQMHVSAEYGRRLCHRALKKLQQAVKEGSLEPAVLMP